MYSPDKLQLTKENIIFYIAVAGGNKEGVEWETILPPSRKAIVQHIPVLTQEAFYELTKNAFDAMPHGGKIKKEVSITEDSVTISFSDTGVGIPPENLSKVFQEGFTTKPGGTGKGLVLLKEYFEKVLGGKFEVASEIGKGTTFTITLPLSKKEEEDN